VARQLLLEQQRADRVLPTQHSRERLHGVVRRRGTLQAIGIHPEYRRIMPVARAVVVSGSLSPASRTRALARCVLSALSDHLPLHARIVDVATIGSDLGCALTREALSFEAEDALRAIETADVLIAATPVHGGSYTGLFKHLFDLVEPVTLVDTSVILVATGAASDQAAILEQQLRPLFSALKAHPVPTGVYGCPSDFDGGDRDGYIIVSPVVRERIAMAAWQAAQWLESRALQPAATRQRRPVRALVPSIAT
jgi:FMN reductase